jgi:4-hydroxymandelate oxidase
MNNATQTAAPRAALNHIPAQILCARDYEFLARQFLDEPSYAYIAGGSEHDITAEANLRAFADRTLQPRLLCDVRDAHTQLNLVGLDLPHPLLLAPVAFQKLAHPAGEVETARAAAAMQSVLTVSTLASQPLEAVAATPGVYPWFQLYFQPDRAVTLDLLRRARNAGYRAILLTLDASIQVPSFKALRAGFVMPEHCLPGNLAGYPTAQQPHPAAGASRIFQGIMRHAPRWDDLAWLQAQADLPIWVKGVLHPDDAVLLRERGVTGLVVSNHGGRTLDGAPASLNVLPAIRKAVGDDYPLLLDSGIRSGMDVFKAIASGADAVMIGRLQVYALAVAGALGVAHMLKLLREELEVCMAMSGCANLEAVRQTTLFPFLFE